MRRLVWVLAVLVVVWGGWWMAATSTLESGANRWLVERRAAGWQADVGSLKVSGFPGTFDMALSGIALADPAAGVAIAAQDLRISALSYWPADITVFLPQTPLEISTPDSTITLTTTQGQAALRLHPGTTLQLDHLTASSGPWQMDLPQGNLLRAQDFRAEMTQIEAPETYRFAFNATQLIPGGLARAALKLPLDWPLEFEAFFANLTVTFDTPIDRFTLEDRRPQPRDIVVQGMEANWGPLLVRLEGNLQVDAQGTPEGQLDLFIENWPDALDLAEKSGAIAQSIRPQAELMLTALANLGDDPTTLDLTLRFANGGMFLGPIPLGPAPRLALR